MKRIKNSFLLLFVGFLLFSCVKEIQYNGDDEASRLVVNSIVQPGQVMTVSLEKSVFFLQEYNAQTSFLPAGATATMLDLTTGVSESGANSGANFYSFSLPVTEGHQYRLTVTHPDFETVTAQTIIPQQTMIASLDTVSVPYEHAPFERIKATISWQDSPGDHFYIIQVRRGDTGSQGYAIYNLSSMDGAIENHSSFSPGTGNIQTFLALKDDTFKNEMKSLDVFIPKETGNWEYQIDLLSCDKAAYNYIISTSIALQNQLDVQEDFWDSLIEGGIQSALVEPIIIQSNIENGFGVFGSVNRTSITF